MQDAPYPCDWSHAITGRLVPLAPAEIELFALDARCKIGTAGDELAHCHDDPAKTIWEAVDSLSIGLRMLRAVEHGRFPVDEQVIAYITRERDGTAHEAEGTAAFLADYDVRGIEAYADRDVTQHMTAVELIEDVRESRASLAKHERELVVYDGFLNGWQSRES